MVVHSSPVPVDNASTTQITPVGYAYELNGRGNTFTNVRLILLGLIVVYISVPFLYIVHEFIRTVGGAVLGGTSSYEQFLLFVATVCLFGITARMYGSLIGEALFTMVGKSQSTRDVTIITAILGAAAFGMYLVVHRAWHGEGGFNSWVDMMVLAVVLLTMLVGLVGKPAALMRRTPVCPPCGTYMQKKQASRFNCTNEAEVLHALNSGEYARLRDFTPADKNMPAHEVVTVSIWECRRCHQHGFVNAEREQPKDTKKPDFSPLQRVDILCSLPLDEAAITTLKA